MIVISKMLPLAPKMVLGGRKEISAEEASRLLDEWTVAGDLKAANFAFKAFNRRLPLKPLRQLEEGDYLLLENSGSSIFLVSVCPKTLLEARGRTFLSGHNPESYVISMSTKSFVDSDADDIIAAGGIVTAYPAEFIHGRELLEDKLKEWLLEQGLPAQIADEFIRREKCLLRSILSY